MNTLNNMKNRTKTDRQLPHRGIIVIIVAVISYFNMTAWT